MSGFKLRLPPTLVRTALAGHSTLGLGIAALLYIIALTGTVAMLAPELDRLQMHGKPVAGPVAPTLVARTIETLAAEQHWARVTVEYPLPTLPYIVVTAKGDAAAEPERFAVTPGSGELVPLTEPWSDFLIDLHERLTIPGMFGLIIVGILGIAMLALTLGGLLAHPRLFRDAFQFRAGAAPRQRQADLHNRLSVWPLPFHAMIAFTGALLALSLPIATVTGMLAYRTPPATIGTAVLGPSAGKDRTTAPLPPITATLKNIDANAIQRVIVMSPGTAGQMMRVDIRKDRHLLYGDRLFFDGEGAALNAGGMLDRSASLQAFNAMFALHFGTFGGLPVRLIYVVLGLMLCTVIVSGVRIWLVRRRTRGTPSPRLERLWTGWVWGSGIALGASFFGDSFGLSAGWMFLLTLGIALLGFVVPIRRFSSATSS